MKAIVLSFDQQAGLVELLHKKYLSLWPACPFIFRIPVNSRTHHPSLEYLQAQRNIELLDSPPGIKDTMTVLLHGLPDDEWVFWCSDDRYPIEILDLRYLLELTTYITNEKPNLNGLKLFRWQEEIREDRHLQILGKLHVLQQNHSLWGFWHHHFCKVKVLKYFFFSERLPKSYSITKINETFHNPNLPIPVLADIWLPEQDVVLFGEPCSKRRLTRNGWEELQKNSCPLPPYPRASFRMEFRHRTIPAIANDHTSD